MNNKETLGLKILKPGPLTLVQDQGRKRQQHLGLAEGGAADKHAYFWANHLLGNTKQSACLEITLGPFVAEFQRDTHIAISGADLHCKLNEEHIPNWHSHRVRAGDIIQFTGGNKGIRAYLGVAGGFKTPVNFSSRSEVLREQLVARQIVPHAVLPYDEHKLRPFRCTYTPERFIPCYTDELRLRVLACYQHALFSANALNTFCSQAYTISPNSDRMGYRLQGDAIDWPHSGIVSEGIALGSVQVPENGQPIVLLNDRQTIGGYPKLGTVCQKDCSQLAQRRPGDTLRFDFVSRGALYNSHPTKNWLHPLT